MHPLHLRFIILAVCDASAANHDDANLGEQLALAKRSQAPRHLRGQHGGAANNLRVRRPLHVGRHNAQRKENPMYPQQLGVKYCINRPEALR